eukprot:2646980-Pyramimonas_sp.AAC.1
MGPTEPLISLCGEPLSIFFCPRASCRASSTNWHAGPRGGVPSMLVLLSHSSDAASPMLAPTTLPGGEASFHP